MTSRKWTIAASEMPAFRRWWAKTFPHIELAAGVRGEGASKAVVYDSHHTFTDTEWELLKRRIKTADGCTGGEIVGFKRSDDKE